jgi:deoxyribonuclease IV
MPFLGAHLSSAGGPARAVQAAHTLGCESLQFFLRAPSRWAAVPLTAGAVREFHVERDTAGLKDRCFAHAPYLLNLASADRALRRRSVAVLADELRRGGLLGLAGLVLHPGSAGDGDRSEAEARCRAAIGEAIARAGIGVARLLREGTAGAGGQLGRSVEELARLVPEGGRSQVGLCLDTAHLWGAGCDLVGSGWDEVMAQVGERWQQVAPDLLHINDTNVELGSRRDRHAPPGEGRLGERFYRTLLRDARLREVALVLEIPPGQGNGLLRRALARLRRWRG